MFLDTLTVKFRWW